MTGIERLREFVAGISPITVVCGVTRTSYDREHMEVAGKRLRDFLAAIANQIEREQGERVSRVRILAVVTKMERHVLGHEGMEDSPVARWARELREALGATVSRRENDGVADSPYDAILPEDAEAVAWVRDHGGLDYVMHEWQSRMPRDRYERRRQRLIDHIAECETALGRRNRRIEDLGHRVSDLTTKNAELRRRAMPEGCEWPRYESGEQVRIGDAIVDELGHAHEVSSVEVFDDAEAPHWIPSEPEDFVWLVHGERVKRPAVLAADGNRIEPAMDVWWICEGDERGIHAEMLHVDGIDGDGMVECSPYNGGTSVVLDPAELYVKKPVIDVYGEPIKKGETVWHEDGTELRVLGFGDEEDDETIVRVEYVSGPTRWGEVRSLSITHVKPEPPDSAERIAEDIKRMAEEWCSHPTLRGASEMAANAVGEATMGVALSNLSKRCRALAERERGE